MALEVESIAFKSSANNSSLFMQKSMYNLGKSEILEDLVVRGKWTLSG